MNSKSLFNYQGIPFGYYDKIVSGPNGVRKAWHLQKFARVVDSLPASADLRTILDVGCFAGTFLSLLPEARFVKQVGVDILPEQIDYANSHYGTAFRRFTALQNISDLVHLQEQFDIVTLIEVLEHLTIVECNELLQQIAQRLRPGGCLILSTPNYVSAWPVIEWALNYLSDISYEEQHITKFNYFTIEQRLRAICPDFSKLFRVEAKTTTHFLAPFLAAVNYAAAMKLAKALPHARWRFPFGNLVLMTLRRL